MLKKTLVVLVVLATAGFTAFVVVGRAGTGAPHGDKVIAPKSTFSLGAAREFDGFPVYNAGPSVDGFPLVAVLRRTDGPTNYISFIYGTCQVTGDDGCAPPIEVQVWPACVRNPFLYDSSGPANTKTVVRGVPAAVFEDGLRLEIQTGAATVVIFARDPSQVSLIARALRGVNVPVQAEEGLPAPAAGALTGKLNCSGGGG
jgi:hypothetical protein